MLSKIIKYFFFIYFFYFQSSVIYTQQKQSSTELQDFLNTIEKNMEQGKDLVEKKSFQKATLNTKQTLNSLETLVDLWMPLQERLKKAIQLEEKIIDQTNLENQLDTTNDASKTQTPQIIQSQKKNIQQTLYASKQLEQMLQNQNASNPSQNQNKSSLLEVEKLLDTAKKAQDTTIEYLIDQNYSNALQQEHEAVVALKKALEKLQNNQQQQQQQQKKKQNNQNKQEQQQKQNQQQKNQNQQQNQQQQQQQQKNQTQKKQQNPKAQKALQELQKLQRQAEMKKEQNQNKQQSQRLRSQKIPVEKDW